MTRRGSRAGRRARPVPEPDVGPPTVISLEWDHGYSSVLVDRSPGICWVEPVAPARLGLSAALGQRLAAWLDRQEALSRRWISDGPATEESSRAEAEARRELLTLAYDVRHEAGPDIEVLLEGRPLDRHRAH